MKGAKEVVLQFPPLHESQNDYIFCGAKRAVAACGTKWGKTWGLSWMMAYRLWTERGQLFWWVAPYHKQTRIAYRNLTAFLPKEFYNVNNKEDYIVVPHDDGDTYCFFRSADNPDSLLGEGVHIAVVDEAARMKPIAWDNIQTTLTFTNGDAYIISTPHGRNWFYDVWKKGTINPATGQVYARGYKSFNLPTSANPHVNKEVIEQRREAMTDDMFREFYLAEFLDESAGCFTGMHRCWEPSLSTPIPGRAYVMGVDLGRKSDYTVITVIDHGNKQVVHWERFKGGRWEDHVQRVTETANAYHATVYVDSTGVGDSLCELIEDRYRGNVIGIDIVSNRIKSDLIENLRVEINRGTTTFPGPNQLPELNKELEVFEITPLPSGRWRYEAPSGYHDDCVLSFAIASWGCRGVPFQRTIGYDPGNPRQEMRFIERLKASGYR